MSHLDKFPDDEPVASHYMSHSNKVPNEEPVASCYMSCFDATSNGETKTSYYMSHRNGVLDRNRRALLQSRHELILMPHPTGKAKNSNKHSIFTPTLRKEWEKINKCFEY